MKIILNLFKITKAYRNIYLQKFHVHYDINFYIKITNMPLGFSLS